MERRTVRLAGPRTTGSHVRARVLAETSELLVDGAALSRTLLQLTIGSLRGFESIEGKIPPPQQVRLAGLLDTIRASDLSFVLILADGSRVRGVADDPAALQSHWQTRVVVSGRVFYTSKQRIQRVEADLIAPATDRDLEIWGLAPMLDISPAQLRRVQGSRSGLSAVVGRWPGTETDEEVAAALKELS